jgi:hypothetical protein
LLPIYVYARNPVSDGDVAANARQSDAPPRPPVNVLTDSVGAGTTVNASDPDAIDGDSELATAAGGATKVTVTVGLVAARV